MTAYVIADVQVTDAAALRAVPAAGRAQHRPGRRPFLVRGGTVELLEGQPQPERIVVIEFADAETARRWYHSEEYQRALKIRQLPHAARCSWSRERAEGRNFLPPH